MRAICIGVLGLGNVGAGTIRILRDNKESIEGRLGAQVRVKRILVRDLDRARDVEVDPSMLTTRVEDVIDDPDVRVVVELIGGVDTARDYVLRALRSGKHVVTANKALLAEHGQEIFEQAAKRGLSVYFEGSVAGGIPVLRAIREGLASDRITSITGIVNGTSNFVLDAMSSDGLDYDTVVASAQAAGYAEADPTLDVGGFDAGHKLALLALVSFGMRVDPKQIPTEGITGVRAFDIRMADRLGYVIKSLAIAQRQGDAPPQLRVHPTFVPRDHILAGVHGAYNAVLVESDALGRSLYYGAGAGMMPTGAAVVSDLIEVSRQLVAFSDSGAPPEAFREIRQVEPTPLDDLSSANYLCVHVPNVPGVLGKVASTLGAAGVSIEHMNQDTPGPGEPINMVIITEAAAESKIRAAIEALDALDVCLAPTVRIRMLAAER